MKEEDHGNMYEAALERTWARFGARLRGAHAACVCVLGERMPSERAASALDSGMERLGWGEHACCFAALQADGAPALDQRGLFSLIEGLDPVCAVAADARAAQALADAYRSTVPFLEPVSVLGRPWVAFESFEAMLDDEGDRQRAWSALKRLPRAGRRHA